MSDMDLCIEAKSQPPYGGMWELNRPDKGIVGSGYIFEVLVEHCRQWRLANGLPVGIGFEREVEAVCCEQRPDHCRPCNPALHPRSLSFNDLMTGTSSMFSFMAAGRPLVTGQEAERRAAICATCRFNVPFKTPCGGICASLKRMVETIVGAARTSRDADLHSCYVCGCFLQSAVWLPLDLQIKPLSEAQKKTLESIPHCWKKLPRESK